MGPRTWSYAVNDFEDRKELATPLQDGWGITSDGSHLVVGDSTDKLTWVDAASMQSVRQVAVKGEGEAALQARGRGEEAGRRIGQGSQRGGAAVGGHGCGREQWVGVQGYAATLQQAEAISQKTAVPPTLCCSCRWPLPLLQTAASRWAG